MKMCDHTKLRSKATKENMRPTSRTAPPQRTVSEGGENSCALCQDPIQIFAIGPCDHPICYRCSTRMRVLCEKNDCPICRAPTPQVAFVYNRQPFKDINLRNCIPNRKYKVFFEDEEIEDSYLDLLEYRCKLCPNRPPDKTFALLQTHMRREHQLYACDLCVTHLKLFPHERKFYSRKNLATHRRIGDQDDTSYKGHPICKFCDVRFFDKDELMKHLRKDHFFCHFCDQHGCNVYYDTYEDLKEHFAEEHYLCQEGECGHPDTRFTHAFATEIDLKAHKAAVHGKNLSKAQSKETRTLDLDFQLPPRRRGDNYSDSRSAQGSRGGDRRNRGRWNHTREDADMDRALEASMESFAHQQAEQRPPVAERVPDPVHDFPSLNGLPVSTNVTSTAAPVQRTRSPEEDFPTLSSTQNSSSKAAPSQGKAYSSVMNPPSHPKEPAAAARHESRPVPLSALSNGSRRVASRPAPVSSEENYPSLVSNPKSGSVNQGSWLGKKPSSASNNLSTRTLAISKAPSTAKPVPFKKPISDESEFPSLGGNDKKKSSGLGSGNLFSESWSSVQNKGNKKSSTTPKSERVTDSTFEVPDSYYTSFRDPTESSNMTMISQVERPVAGASAKPSPSSNSIKDFPGLPTREKNTPQADSPVNKKKAKTKKKVKDKQSAQEKVEENNNSLSDIASTLIGAGGTDSKVKQNSAGKQAKAKTPKPTDWFDSPPSELTQKFTPLDRELKGQKKEVRGLEIAAAESRKVENVPSKYTVDDSFPSLHAMSTPVQLQPQPKMKQPPGFASRPNAKSASSKSTSNVPAPPPGFGAQLESTSSTSDLKAISSTLNPVLTPPPGFTSNATFIEPPDFKERNARLIADIRTALETVEDGFSNFRTLSQAFRQGMMEASDYYSNVSCLMGRQDFARIFPELLALLPDVVKQKQLWEVHQAAGVSVDLQHTRMDDPDDFPSLNGLGNKAMNGHANDWDMHSFKSNGSWVKAK